MKEKINLGRKWNVRNAKQSDLDAVVMLLSECKLPVDGVAEAISNFLVAERGTEGDSRLVGVSGLEYYEDLALLRSVAVHKDFRGKGIGTNLVIEILKQAKSRGVKRIYLLTETVQEYFPRFGFRKIQRSQVDRRVQESVEFKQACPKSAIAMKLEL